LPQQIAGDIADKLRAKLSTSEKQQVTKQGTQNPEAYELYLKGRYSWNKRTAADLAMAISYFNQAIAKDHSYALAYSGLADAYNVFPNYGGNPSEDYPDWRTSVPSSEIQSDDQPAFLSRLSSSVRPNSGRYRPKFNSKSLRRP
jgi:hypothetical protein